MSFIGDFFNAGMYRAFGKYNSAVAQNEANYLTQKREQNVKVYDNITKPLFDKRSKELYSNFFVSALNTGAEFRNGGSTYLAGLDFLYNRATDAAILEFNKDQEYVDQTNQIKMAEQRAQGAMFEANLKSNAAIVKGTASLLSSANSYFKWV